MKMWSVRVIILLLFCYACLSTGSGRVDFVSRNFNNTLQWDAAEPAFPGENITYSVEFKSDADMQSFQRKEGCQNIAALSCDLTADTPSVHDVHYWAKVFVNGRPHGKTDTRFTPLAHTTLGPPVLSVHTTVSSLHVNVTLPSGPNGASIADIIANSRNGPIKSVIVYVLEITHPKWAAQVNETTTGRFIINLKNNRTEYCGHVVYMPFFEWGRSKSENTSFCVTLQGDPLMFLPWILITAGLLAATAIVSAVCVGNYVKGGKAKGMPLQLVTTSSIPPRILQPLDENLIISKPELCVESDKTMYATIRVMPNVCPVADVSAQSSETYGVVSVQVPAEERDSRQTTLRDRESTDPPSSSSKEDRGGVRARLTSQLPVLGPFDSDPARSLLLHTVRDDTGQLVLSSLTFRLQNSTEGSQRKLLLSDLIDSKTEGPLLTSQQSLEGSEWSDSGCDDSTLNSPVKSCCDALYSPSQPVVPYLHQGCQNTPSTDGPETGYRQNWMPAIVTGAASQGEYRKMNYSWAWTGLKMDEEGEEEEDREGEEGLRETLLGGWMVHIQE